MLLTEEALKKWTGFSRRSALTRWLESEDIKFWFGQKGRIITTLNFIEKQVGSGQSAEGFAVPRFKNGQKKERPTH